MTKRTFIKILGPPIVEAIRKLEKIAIEIPDFCIMNTIVAQDIPSSLARDIGGVRSSTQRMMRDPIISEYALNYFKGSGGVVLNEEQCEKILSGSPTLLGDYDFFFEWNKEFNQKDFDDLLEKIDEALTPLGCLFTITNQ
jgi:hypothetical protein